MRYTARIPWIRGDPFVANELFSIDFIEKLVGRHSRKSGNPVFSSISDPQLSRGVTLFLDFAIGSIIYEFIAVDSFAFVLISD